MDPDGHRPVSEEYRNLSDEELYEAYRNLGLTPYCVKGSQKERLNQIIQHYELPIVVPVDEAISLAEKVIRENREAVSKRIIEQYEEPTLKEKIKFMTRY